MLCRRLERARRSPDAVHGAARSILAATLGPLGWGFTSALPLGEFDSGVDPTAARPSGGSARSSAQAAGGRTAWGFRHIASVAAGVTAVTRVNPSTALLCMP